MLAKGEAFVKSDSEIFNVGFPRDWSIIESWRVEILGLISFFREEFLCIPSYLAAFNLIIQRTYQEWISLSVSFSLLTIKWLLHCKLLSFENTLISNTVFCIDINLYQLDLK